MKTTYKLIALSALALAIALPVMAQTDDNNTSVDSDTSVNTSIPVPPPFMGEGQGQPGQEGDRPSIRAAIRADINTRMMNAEDNRGIRNAMLERHMGSTTMMRNGDEFGDDQSPEDASGTPRFRDEFRGRQFMASTSTMMGSTTFRGRFMMEYEDNGRAMRKDMFENRKRIVTKELDVAINNLNNISSRLSSRIAKEAATGRDMSAASSSLIAANAKIKIASDAVTALEAYLPSASSTVSASTTVNLDTARTLASTAQQDIKDAQKALNNVVVTIAHSMGLKLGDDNRATSTPDNDNDQPVATSTASTTTQ